jgi:hypothetical protein
LPHRGRDESLVVVASHCRHLGDDAATMRNVVFAAMRDGDDTAGQLLDRLEGMTPAQRRDLLDQARAEAGLPQSAEIDRQQRAQTITVRTVSRPPIPMCPADGCTQIPARHGMPYDPGVRRWHCRAHEHLA